MNRRGITLIELMVAVAVFTLLLSLALRAFLLSDRMILRSEAKLKQTLGRVALQAQLRSDIWGAAQFRSGPADDVAEFIMPDETRAIYSAAAGKTSRTHQGHETLYQGTVIFSQGRDGLIAVLGYDTAEWGFAAKMRNRAGEAE